MNPLVPLAAALHELGLPFVVVGSTASSARGVPRATLDIDLVVRIAASQARRFASLLGSDWYADPEHVRDALEYGRSFNLIHLPSTSKLDIFPADAEFEESELRRATLESIEIDGEVIRCPVATAEDVILAKLRWFKNGGEVSERQWRDIGGVIAANHALDYEYLRLWAGRLKVADLLEKALL